LKREQGDIGKLKQNNDKLKMEMQSLKAMLAAQAKEDASNSKHTEELEAKQQEIDRMEKRVAELEELLSTEKATVEQLEAELKAQKEQAAAERDLAHAQLRSSTNRSSAAPGSPKHARKLSGKSPHHEARVSDAELHNLSMPGLPSNYVSPEVVAKHKASVSRLEEELKSERKLRRDADGEIIKLRAAINGVQLNDSEVDALLAQKLQAAQKKTERYVGLLLFVVGELNVVYSPWKAWLNIPLLPGL
jgi:chromosome segregation ATPase